jgi:poly-beta-1,6-N-acetyl-D-glucosamine biosynthesis protein PgaD
MTLPTHIRVRCADEHPLIFERPGSQPKVARRAMVVATGIGWTIWIYLWRPALSVLLWLLGVNVMQHQWIELAGWTGLVEFSTHTLPYGMALCATLLIWASVNLIRFGGNERRKARPLANAEADAQWTRMSSTSLAESRSLQTLVCCHDDEGHLIRVLSGAEDDAFSVPVDDRAGRVSARC